VGTLTENFQDIYSQLVEEKDFTEAGPCVYPPLGIESNNELKQRLAEQLQAQNIPKMYHEPFLKKLLDRYDSIDNRCMSAKEPMWCRLYLSMVNNAALQSHPKSKVDKEIRHLQAVVSDLYKSFIVSRGKLRGLPELQQELPPLVCFTGYIAPEPLGSPIGRNPWQAEYIAPPYMLEIDSMQRDVDPEIRIGVMNMSAGFREHPLLWGLLTHEVGGHAVLHADKMLLTEMTNGIWHLFSDRNPILGPLWAQWFEEAASDVCGLLNMGPSYTIGAFIFYSALSGMIEVPPKRPKPSIPPKLDNVARTLYQSQIVDYHYPQILMPHLLMGAIEHLHNLSLKARFEYLEKTKILDTFCTAKQQTLEFPAGAIVQDKSGNTMKLQEKYDLDEMRASAHAVGAFLVSEQFRALGGNDLQALETWDDPDEKRAQLVAQLLITGDSSNCLDDIAGKDDADEFDDGCLLAGALLALLENPKRYGFINKTLGRALEVSYKTDRILHPPSEGPP